MSIDNFKPVIWSAKLLKNLNDAHVFVSCFNTDYEGEIKNQGDSVRINSIGRITTKTYTNNAGLGAVSAIDAPEIIDDATMVLQITERDYFNFGISDVDAYQIKPKLMDAAMMEAGWSMSDASDEFGATTLNAGVATANQLTAATSVGTGATDDDAYEILVDLNVKLTENNVPRDGRWVVVPPWFHGTLLKDPRFVSYGTAENIARLKNGLVGRAAGLEIKESNNVPVNGLAYTLIAGHTLAATFAQQIDKVDAFQPHNGFSDAMKGLHLYGAKVTRPYALASIACTQAT